MKANEGRKPRLLLVDDHPVVREGIRSYLSGSGVAEVVGEAEDGVEGLRLARALLPDVVLVDINLPGMNGFGVAEALRSELPNVRVVILTMHKSREYAVQVLDSGASGYLCKDEQPAEMALAVKAVYAGQSYFSPAVRQFVLDELVERSRRKTRVRRLRKKAARPQVRLTPRERVVLRLIARGNTSKEISERLGCSERTVTTHREHIMEKTGLHNVVKLVLYAIELGLVEMPSLRVGMSEEG